ncbi:MAG: IS30 family transposase [Oscillospiraceae bacterium]
MTRANPYASATNPYTAAKKPDTGKQTRRKRQGKSKACFATLAERKTRFYIAVKMPDRSARTMENAIVSALAQFPPQLVKTITCDRGSEFANWRKIKRRLGCEVYFADPYCAWQKGTNENTNGLLRAFYPKGRNLSRVAPAL